MQFNWYMLLVAGLVPLLTGFLWYNPKTFGNAWLKSIQKTEEDMKGANMALIFGLTYLFGCILATALMPMVIHQMGFMSVLADEPGINEKTSEISLYAQNFYDNYGTRFRTFKHGSFHGILTSIFLVLPIISIVALFERKGFIYIAVHVGYWALTLGIMGGLICQFI